MKATTLLILIAVNFIYALIGAAVMMALESSNEEVTTTNIVSVINTFLSDHSKCMTSTELASFLTQVKSAYDSGVFTTNQTSSSSGQWDFGNSIFFVMTATTTIGYGNQTPSTRGGKAFIVIYALLGIPVTAIMILGIAEKLKKLYAFLQYKIIPCLKTHPKAEALIKFIILHLIVLTVLVLLPSVVFCAMEGWAYGDALYYCFITFMTIGFGDYVLVFQRSNSNGDVRIIYKLFVLIWIVIGLAWVGSVISECTERYQKFVAKQEEKKNVKDTDAAENMKNENTDKDTNTAITIYRL